MSSHIRVNDYVRTVPDGITGAVSSIQQKLVRTIADGDEIRLVLRVVATIRVSVSGYYGEYVDIPVDELEVIPR